MTLLHLAAALMALTAATHSWLGEARLITPLLATREGPMASALGRRVLRFAWHLTSALMLASAAAIIVPGAPPLAIAIIAVAWLIPGIVDAFYTRGRHVGWPLLVAAGALPLLHLALT